MTAPTTFKACPRTCSSESAYRVTVATPWDSVQSFTTCLDHAGHLLDFLAGFIGDEEMPVRIESVTDQEVENFDAEAMG